jgi:mannose-1-phosphate guanylyltransferase
MAGSLDFPPCADLLVGGIYDVRKKGHPLSGRRAIVVGRRKEGAVLLPYPVDLDAAPEILSDAGGLSLVFGDLAAARVLSMRRLYEEPGPKEGPPAAAGRIDTAMVLCAGLGTRLRPLSDRLPKPALPFFGAPLLRYTFALLKRAGVSTVVVNTHHLPEQMAQTAEHEAQRRGLSLRVSHEDEVQGTGGGVRDAQTLLAGAPFLLVNGDAFLSVDLGAIIAAHVSSGASATLAVTRMPEGAQYGSVEAERDGSVRRLAGVGRPGGRVLRWHFLGIHVVEPEIFDHIPAHGPQDINRVVYPKMIAQGRRVQIHEVNPGAWADLGTPARYLDAGEDLMTGLCDLGPLGDAAPLSAEEAARLRAAGFWGRSHVHPSARVGLGTMLVRAQVGPGARVGRGAALRRAAVLSETTVGDGEELFDTLAYEDLRIAAQ